MKLRLTVLVVLLAFQIGQSDEFAYILCEGNFNSANASLWQLSDTNELIGPVHWDVDDNPLGDVGQNLKIHQDKLYIVMNNSNSLEVMALNGGATYERTISLTYAGPRDIAFVDDHAYITCWYLPGILALDLNTWQIDDTIAINGLPDNIIADNGRLYTSIAMNIDWSAADKVIALDSTGGEYAPSDTFTVISGPNQLLLNNDKLYVLSTYYDASWNTYTGTSCIDLTSGNVTMKDLGITTNFCDDIALINGSIYRSYNGGVAPLTDSLTINSTKAIGSFSGVYSMAFNGTYIFMGLSDYSAPDQVVILDTLGNIINTLTVGVCPGSFAFVSYPATNKYFPAKTNLPADFTLMANYPNPFNSRTVIPFYLKNANHLKLAVYNLKGELVAVLADANYAAGYHTITWDGHDHHGLFVPTEMYLAQMKVQDLAQTMKMLLVK